jgi:hypothetical protein
MPYDVVRVGRKWKVKTRDGRVVGSHDTKEQAEAQRRALYANEGKHK